MPMFFFVGGVFTYRTYPIFILIFQFVQGQQNLLKTITTRYYHTPLVEIMATK